MKTFLRKSGRCTRIKACVCTHLCCLCAKVVKTRPKRKDLPRHRHATARSHQRHTASPRLRAMLSSRLSLRAQLMRIAAPVSNALCGKYRVVCHVPTETTAERNGAHSTPFGRVDRHGALVQRITTRRCMERQRCQRTAGTSGRQRSFLHDLRKSSTR